MRTLQVFIELPDELVREQSDFARPEVHAQLHEHEAGQWTAVTHTKGDVDCVFSFDGTAELLAFVREHQCDWCAADDGKPDWTSPNATAALLAALD